MPPTGVDVPPTGVDVVVIGAGIAGASAAAALSEHAAVALVEREPQAGHHATGRSASVLSETSGHPVVCALAAASRPYFERGEGILSPRGLMWIGRREDTADLDGFAEQARHVAPSVRRLDAEEALVRLAGFRAAAVAGGAVEEREAMAIDTDRLLHSFLGAARRNGAAVVLGAPVLAVERRGPRRWSVATGTQTLRCDHVVDAAGAWADEVATMAGARPARLRPLRRTAVLVPAPDWVDRWPLVMDVAGRFYLEPEPGGLLVSPADETESAPVDARPEELDVALALQRLAEATTVPVHGIRRAWAGLRTFAADRVPVLGEDPEAAGFWWLAGQGGAGIKTAPAMAAILAAQMLGTRSPPWRFDDAVLSPARLR